MAKLYKIEGYLCDANGDLKDAEDFRSYFHMLINRGYYTLDAPIDFKITESKEFEWNDHIDLNYHGCSEEDCKKYFE